MKYVKKLVCIDCGEEYDAEPDKYLCSKCDNEGILEVEYDYNKIKEDWSIEDLKANEDLSIWRYLPLLPVKEETPRPSLRVGWTPVYDSDVLAQELGLEEIYLKDDGLNPTGSLKDRASAMAVVKAQEAGATTVACSSTGNAASSLAGNVASMGGKMDAVIFVPERAPMGKVTQLLIYGAEVVSVQGSYEEAYYLSDGAIKKWDWYNRNAGINPYLVEGKKTVSLELAEQLNFEMPDWLVFSVGDGCTIAGAWKGLYDLKQIGFIDKIPKLIGVQAEGCAPITKSFRTEKPLETTSEDTLADSIAVGKPRNYKKALNAIRESDGTMVNVSDEEILDMMVTVGQTTGVFGEPAGVTGFAGLKKLVDQGVVAKEDKVAAVITGNGLKDITNGKKAAGEPLEVPPNLELLEKTYKRGDRF
ncbi:threonine synthase [Selenihalanaerobacter shriftii]|uniref:Threonine synthase n=1 Tax=Selenihalanaerobacter shriftii TaxID=142842 RepID=A0A1T4PJ89_9FIRM|nr:threonine synthase [Selenihalanaerobacter shriftii]SJZ91471.1 L-threonine synthase [Selenihalanaerobacter shriftii]